MENNWISVNDDFPESHQWVIVYNPHRRENKIYMDYFRNISTHEHRWNIKDNVTHWMPLPEPPKTEQQ